MAKSRICFVVDRPAIPAPFPVPSEVGSPPAGGSVALDPDAMFPRAALRRVALRRGAMPSVDLGPGAFGQAFRLPA